MQVLVLLEACTALKLKPINFLLRPWPECPLAWKRPMMMNQDSLRIVLKALTKESWKWASRAEVRVLKHSTSMTFSCILRHILRLCYSTLELHHLVVCRTRLLCSWEKSSWCLRSLSDNFGAIQLWLWSYHKPATGQRAQTVFWLVFIHDETPAVLHINSCLCMIIMRYKNTQRVCSKNWIV